MTNTTATTGNKARGGAPSPCVALGRLPGAVKPHKTFLIDIADPSPRRVSAVMKYFDKGLSDVEIVAHFKDPKGWGPIKEPAAKSAPAADTPDVRTRLDLDVSDGRPDTWALVAFRVAAPDEFITSEAGADLAITGGRGEHAPEDLLFEPTWVPDGGARHSIVRMIAGPGAYRTRYNLGIVLKDSETGASYQTPIILDPKIEDQGG